ncbi:hypothetical protein [Pseudomonas sp. MWU16-30317]|uniref:hypothetical protein n=1 Tax=Pseudomonas sp. MWU16-30317 TaxID=2878095 RepID=UPI0031F92791
MAVGLIAAGIGITLVPESVRILHRDNIREVSLQETNATLPIILSHRAGAVSVSLQHHLRLIETLRAHPST